MARRKGLRLNRRQLLAAGAAATLLPGALAGCGKKPDPQARRIEAQTYDNAVPTDFAPEAVAPSPLRFPLGVMAGAMREASALLWTFAQGGGELRVRVWRELEAPGTVALVRDQAVTCDAAGYVKVPVDGLAPATRYRYGFFSPDFTARAELGAFRTAWPSDWAEPLTFGATSCTHFKFMPYTSLQLAARLPLDLFLHLGDLSYNDGAYSLAEYRAKWQRTLQDPGYRALLPAVGSYAVWDDHEIANNFDPEEMALTAPEQLAAGKQAFFETLAVERGENDRLWRSYLWGQTAEFFVMDCRSERKPSTREGPGAQYLSSAQLAWLKDGLAASPAHFKVLLNSVPLASFPAPLWGTQADRWQGYPAQRDDLLDFITGSGVRNVWSITGDFHMGLVLRIEKEGPRSGLWEIAAGPGANKNNPLALALDGGAANRELAFPAAQFDYAYGDVATTTFTLDPKDDSVLVRFYDPSTEAIRYEKKLRQT